MNRIVHLLTVVTALTLGLTGCGEDPAAPPAASADAELLAAAWSAYDAGDTAEAHARFDALRQRGLLALAHDGLGWCFARESAADSARVHFAAAAAVVDGTSPLSGDVHAGLAFACDAVGDRTGSLAAAASVPAGWSFAHAPQLDRDDVTLLEAACHYALGQFVASLSRVQVLDPGFAADVGSASGRAALAARIAALQS
jgi:hypothetical protein